MQRRYSIDHRIKYLLFFSAIVSIIIVFIIFFFFFQSSLPAFQQIGLKNILLETTWRPTTGQYGILDMIVGSVMVTFMAIVMGVPLAMDHAFFLEVVGS